MKTIETTEEVSLHPGEKGRWSTKSLRNTSRAVENATVDLEKRLVKLRSRTKMSKIKKSFTPVVGQKSNVKSQAKSQKRPMQVVGRNQMADSSLISSKNWFLDVYSG